MGVKVTNNAFGTLSASVNTSVTTVTLDSGQGARFPTLGAGDHFYGTIVDTSNNIEIVKVTARSTDSMTVVRAQDNTTAQSFAIGDRFELRPVAALFEDVINESSVLSDTSPQLGGDLDLNSNAITDGTFLADSSRVRIPNSATAPSSPNAGDMYYDTDSDSIFHYNGTSFVSMSNKFSASGGTETTSGNYKIHTFTSSGTFTVSAGSASVEYLVIGGGGGGGLAGPGGGGAGGYRSSVSGESSGGGASAETALSIGEGSYSITIGGGGATAPNTSTAGVSGSNSVFSTITSLGGGGGGSGDGIALPNSGGSGGGGSYFDSGAAGTAGQGFAGGSSNTASYSGGGGGAGSVGSNATSGVSGNGGSGVTSSINGSATTRGGGGGGYISGSGGSGGGGNHGSSGSANTGGGGGGNATGGNGGSGLVIIRYLDQ